MSPEYMSPSIILTQPFIADVKDHVNEHHVDYYCPEGEHVGRCVLPGTCPGLRASEVWVGSVYGAKGSKYIFEDWMRFLDPAASRRGLRHELSLQSLRSEFWGFRRLASASVHSPVIGVYLHGPNGLHLVLCTGVPEVLPVVH